MSRSWNPWSLSAEPEIFIPATALASSIRVPGERSEVAEGKKDPSSLIDFMTILALAQDLDVDFLPITWHPAVETLGAGATAEIRQALVDIQTSFAFKRISLERKDAFAALASEISVLKCPTVDQHENIITLAGMCWDVDRSGPTIWPVLVFDKAPFGNLEEFIQSLLGKQLSYPQLLEIMKDIGRALACLHQCSIVHGDVKPNNILVFPHETNKYCVKLADFGYASFSNGSEPIYLATPEIWADPSYRGEGLDLATAKKMEIYSFGMVCAWLLHQASSDDQLYHTAKLIPLADILQKLEDLSPVLAKSPDSNSRLLQNLNTFFALTLGTNKSQRTTDVMHLTRLFDAADMSISEESLILKSANLTLSTALCSEPGWSARLKQHNFQISKSVFRLLKADFRLPGFIAKQLLEQAEILTDMLTKSNAQFQLAVCYAIGFGVRRNLVHSKLWLSACSKDEKDLEIEIEIIRAENQWPYQSRTIKGLETNGSLDLLDPRFMEYAQQVLKQLETHYLEQIQDFEQVFDSAHSIVVLTKFLLGGVLDKAGRYEEAYGLYVELAETMGQTDSAWGAMHRSTLISWTQAAAMAFKTGKHDQANMLYQSIFEGQSRTLGKQHTETLCTADALAVVLKEQGKYREAEKLSREVLKARSDVLGEGHPDTLVSLSNLSMILSSAGDLREAESLLRECVSARKSIFGKGNGDTMICQSNLSAIQTLMGNFAEAERIANEVLLEMEETRGFAHPDSFYTQGNLISTMHALGKFDKAREIGNRLLQQKDVIGANNPYHLTIMSQMALMLQEEGFFGDSLDLDREILQKRKELLGDHHPDTLVTQNNIAATLQRQGDYNGAKELYEKVLDLRENSLGQNHPATLDIKANLAYLLRQMGDFDLALTLSEDTLARSVDVLGPDHHHTLMSKANLGDLYLVLGNTPRAAEIFTETLDARLKLLGESHHHTVQSMDQLAVALLKLGENESAEKYFRRALRTEAMLRHQTLILMNVRNNLGMQLAGEGRCEEARDYIKEALAERRQLLGPDHPDTVTSLYNLGWVDFAEGQYGPAVENFRSVLDTRRKVLGNDHPDTLHALKTLAEALSRNGQYSEGEKLDREFCYATKRKHGENHPKSLNASLRLALALKKQGILVEAEQVLSRVVEIGSREQDFAVLDLLNSQYYLAMVRDALGKHKDAEMDLRHVLEQREQKLGPEHDYTLQTMNLLGLVVRNLGRLEEAFELLERTLRGRERMPNNESQIYETLALQGLVRQDQGNLEAAIQLNERALAGWESVHGPDHPVTLSVVENLASLTFQQDNGPKSLDLHRRVMEGREAVLGPLHPDTIESIRGLGAITYYVGAEQESKKAAIPLYERAHSLCCQLYGSDHQRSKEIEDEMRLVQELIEEANDENETVTDIAGN